MLFHSAKERPSHNDRREANSEPGAPVCRAPTDAHAPRTGAQEVPQWARTTLIAMAPLLSAATQVSHHPSYCCHPGLTLSPACHPGDNPGANLKSTPHRCHLILVACVWELTKENIDLPLGCLQGGGLLPFTGVRSSPKLSSSCTLRTTT